MQIRQQLPLKLASKLGGSSSTLPAGLGSGIQQMLPLKLSQGIGSNSTSNSETRRSIGSAAGGYQRLSSGSFSPPDPPQTTPSHSRTGSSPAMMQNIEVNYSSVFKILTLTTVILI